MDSHVIASSGGISGSTGTIDNAILRANGTGGSTLQGSTATLSDGGALKCSTLSVGNIVNVNGDSTQLQVNRSIGFCIGDPNSTGPTGFIVIDADNVMALRNGTNGQTWIVSRTFTDPGNKSEFQAVVTGSTVAFTIVEAGSGVGSLTGYTFDKPVTAGANAIKGLITTNANATTGLIAGALAALTNASIVIYDGTGTAYRVPCVTP